MAMTAWSTTAANNILANTAINMDEGMAPSALNDSIREIMAVLKTAIDTGNLTATGTTFNLVNATATTVNFAGAASVALNIGHASAAAAFAGGISIPTGKTLSGAGAINITGNITGAAISGTTGTFTDAINNSKDASGGTFANRITQTNADVGGLAAWQVKTGASANIWQFFARNGDGFIGQAGVVDAMKFTATTGAVTISGTLGVTGLAAFGTTTDVNAGVKAELLGVGKKGGQFNNNDTATATLRLYNAATTGQTVFQDFYSDAGSARGSIYYDRASTGNTIYAPTSDERLKIVYGDASIDEGASRLRKRVVRILARKETPEQKYTGFVAQEQYSVSPLGVKVGGDDEKKEPWLFDQGYIVPDLVMGWQNHEARLRKIEAR